MRIVARALAALVVVGAVTAVGGPAWAQVGAPSSSDDDSIVVISGDVDLGADADVDSIVVIRGDVSVEGTVRGSVFVVRGDVVVRGTVEESVISLRGRVRLEEGASVGGDITSSRRAVIADGATVGGSVNRVDVTKWSSAFGWISLILLWIAVTVSTLLLGLLLLVALSRRGAAALADAGRTSVGASIGLGLAVAVGLPVAGVLLLVTVVGLPLGIGVLLALGLVYALGYVIGAYFVGQVILKPATSPFLAFLVGWAILRAVELLPLFGGLVGAGAAVYGLGMAAVAIWRVRAGGPAAAPAAPLAAAAAPAEPTTAGPTSPEPPPQA
ncbi:MAG: hypothetical protein IPM45_05510 [Acidimicrobiales bacterium]|nr:hypothetical protein [Acidimicrobiales bacterium]